MDHKIFQDKITRRYFFIITGLLLILILILRLFVFKNPDIKFQNLAASILENIFISLLVSIIVSFLIFFIIRNEQKSHIEIIPYQSRGSSLVNLRKNTTDYFYIGNIGSYARSVTLHHLSESASSRQQTTKFKLQLLDFKDEQLCNRYSRLKNSVSSNGNVDSRKVKNSVMSTILEANKIAYNNSYLKVEVSFRQDPAFLRYDISSSKLLITKEDPKAPAILADSNSFLYSSIKEEIQHSQRIEIKLPLNDLEYNDHSIDNIKLAVDKLGFGDKFDAEDFQNLLDMLTTNENPYAKYG